MLLNLENLGEKTLNKIAEMALASRFTNADRLTVQIKTDPELLAKGTLESLAIDGRGLVMNPFLRMQEMRIDLQTIAVNPFKALMGNIQLTRPGRGTVRVVLNERDIETAYRSLPRVESAICRVRPAGEVSLQLKTISTGERKTVNLTAIPRVNEGNIDVAIAGLDALSPVEARAISEKTREIFHLKNFTLDGFTLDIESIEIGDGTVTLQGRAGITKFPVK
jgi:hypothetical protein